MVYVAVPVMLVILSVKLVQSQETCDSFYAQSNFKLTGHVVKTVNHSPTQDHCIDECKLHTKCHSINYHHGDGICELNDASHLNQPVRLVPGDGYQYVNYNHRKPATCSGQYCSTRMDVCLIDGNGKDYKCTPCKGNKRIGYFLST